MASQLPVDRPSPSTWWRWPLLPFATLIGSVLGSALIYMLQWLGMKMSGGYTEDGWMFKYVLPVMQSAVFGYLYARIACYVAPRGKVIAGVVMVTLLLATFAVFLLVAWIRPPVHTGAAIQATIGVIAAGIAAVVGLIQAHEEQ